MKHSTHSFAFLLFWGITAIAWAGPAEEIAQVDDQIIQAINECNLDGIMALHADDAVLTPTGSPFRIEGKQAIRASAGILNAYFTFTGVDRAGTVSTSHARVSLMVVKQGDRWLIVDDHGSRLP
jgi:ketosteroid isomerase-like protein